MWEFVDKAVYINLARRSDRNEKMKEMTKTLGDKVVRFEAIEASPGCIGCSLSHIEILKMAIDNNWKSVLILEDDAEWNNFEDGYSKLQSLSLSPYDVIVLGGSCIRREGDRVFSCQTTVGYLVHNHYYKTLLENYKTGVDLLQQTRQATSYALDQYWKHLQHKDNWFIIVPCLVYQRPDYSDIEGKYVDYRDAFYV